MPSPFDPPRLQQQRQMEQFRQREMEGAYWEGQQRARSNAEERLRQETERFLQAQGKAEALRRRHAAGELSEAEFRKGMQDLAVQDASGTWWSVGLKSGDWHRYDGRRWTRANPRAVLYAPAPEACAFSRSASRHPFRALVRFVLTFALFGALGLGGALVADNAGLQADPGLLFIGGLGLGLAVALLSARRAYRGG